MDRAEVAAAVGARLGNTLAGAGLAATDTPGNLREPIDDALRQLGVRAEDLATADVEDSTGFVALVRHRALLLVLDRLADTFDVSTGGDSFKLSQQVANAEKALARAEAELRTLFGAPFWPVGDGTETQTSVTTFDLNFLGGE